MLDAAMTKAGSFLAPMAKDVDVGAALGTKGARFDEVAVDEAVWVAWTKAGLVDEWQALAQGLLGPYEEAWFAADKVTYVVTSALAKRAALDADAARALDNVIALLERAQSRGVTVVFAG